MFYGGGNFKKGLLKYFMCSSTNGTSNMTNMAPPLKMTIVKQSYQQTQVPHIKKTHITYWICKFSKMPKLKQTVFIVIPSSGGRGKKIINGLLIIQCMVK